MDVYHLVVDRFPIHFTFLVHLFCVSCALVGSWLGLSYLAYNSFFLACLLWSIADKSRNDPLAMSVLIGGLSILMDIIVLAEYFHMSDGVFSKLFSLLNLLLRPLTEFLLLKALKDRDNVNHDYQSANNAAVPNPIPSSRLAFHDMPPPAHETHLRDSAISQASYQSEMGTPPPQYQQIQTGPKY